MVERPASVVKELVENSIDAGASSISIDITAGGTKRIAITDNGCGMDADDLGRSVLRHATSKIAEEDDLYKISTMGFRGEALAAIGAVSRLTILSRLNNPAVIEGARIEVDGGAVKGPVVAGCASGTQVEISDLFFNVPARQKFLRSQQVEAGHVIDTVNSLALSHPEIRFDLISDGNRRISLQAGAANERVIEVLGEKFRGHLILIEENTSDITIHGFIAEGGRSGGKDVHFFLNNRPVRDRILMHALSQGFEAREISGSGPAAALWIEINPSQVDVNVHPAKREVRFVKGNAVHDFVVSAIRKALTSCGSWIVNRESLIVENIADQQKDGVANAMFRFEEKRLGDTDITRDRSFKPVQQKIYAEEAARILKPIGQIGQLYIACEHDDGSLVIIDQHAAHERLAFDDLRAQYSSGKVRVQRLLIPQRVELGAKESAVLCERLDALMASGFEVEPFGGNSIIVKATPEILGDADVAPLFTKIADEFSDVGSSVAIADVIERIFALVACHRQVRAGDKLSHSEIEALVRDVERHDVKTCPHGRPAIVQISRSEMDKWFKRV